MSTKATATTLPGEPAPRSIHVLTNGRIVIEPLSSSPECPDPFPHISFSPAASSPTATTPTTDPNSNASTVSTLVFDGTSATPTIDTLPVDDYGPILNTPDPLRRAHRSASTSIARQLSHVGLLGVLDLGFAAHLLYATRATCVAQVAGAPIYKVTAVDSLPIVSPPTRSMAQENYESSALRHLVFYLNHHPMFFSRHMDLSRSIRLQSLAAAAAPSAWQPNWDFVLNATLLPRSLMHPAAASSSSASSENAFFIPVIAGHVSHAAPHPNLSLTLIARTNTLRLGRRYFSRGMSPTGGSGCSNAIESELIVSRSSTPMSSLSHSSPSAPRTYHLASHLQWRGSVPLVWSQVPTYDLTHWKPPVVVSALHAPHDWNPVERYLHAWTKLVPRVLFLDLLDRRNPGERVLSETLEQAVGELRDATEPVANTQRRRREGATWGINDEDEGGEDQQQRDVGTRCWPVEYIHFAVASRTHDAVRAVEAKVAGHDGLTQVTSVVAGGAGGAKRGKTQSTVIRTNCLDSIDRTNLVQLQIADLALGPLLDAVGLPEPLADVAAVQCALRTMWIAHGHDLARLYVGTRAVSQELACPSPPPSGSPSLSSLPALRLQASWSRPWIGIGIDNECTLTRRQYLQYFVDPALQDVLDEHLSAPARAAAPSAASSGTTPWPASPQHHRQHLFALQRKISTDECDLPLIGFAFVFVRKHLAPMNVDGLLGLMASLVWMTSAVVVQWWLGGGQSAAAKAVVRKPRRLVQVAQRVDGNSGDGLGGDEMGGRFGAAGGRGPRREGARLHNGLNDSQSG